MAYAIVAQFIEVFGEREAAEVSNLDDARNVTSNNAAIANALESATSEIDGYLLQAGYTLPLAAIPAILMRRCCDIARYRLEQRNTREETVARYKDAISWCKDLVKGLATLGPGFDGGGVPVINSPASSIESVRMRGGSTFNARSLRGY